MRAGGAGEARHRRRRGSVRRRGPGAEAGASAIELAIVAPAILLLMFLGIQTALWLYGRNVAEQSAREGVSRLRLVIVGSDVTSALAAARIEAENYARTVGRESIIDPVADASVLTPGTGRVRVSVSGHAVSLVPGLSFTVHAAAEANIEQFTGDR